VAIASSIDGGCEGTEGARAICQGLQVGAAVWPSPVVLMGVVRAQKVQGPSAKGRRWGPQCGHRQ